MRFARPMYLSPPFHNLPNTFEKYQSWNTSWYMKWRVKPTICNNYGSLINHNLLNLVDLTCHFILRMHGHTNIKRDCTVLHTPHACALLEPDILLKFMWLQPLKLSFLYTDKDSVIHSHKPILPTIAYSV
jgi:hypothetical protein